MTNAGTMITAPDRDGLIRLLEDLPPELVALIASRFHEELDRQQPEEKQPARRSSS